MREKQGSSWQCINWSHLLDKKLYETHSEATFNGANSTNMQAIARWFNRKFDLELTVWYQQKLS
jgi:hypothetical protein